MRLPILPLILSIQLVAWCIFGVISHGWQILLYPMSWGLIVTAFLILNYFDNRRRSAVQQVQETDSTSPNPNSDVAAPISTPRTNDPAVTIN